MTAAYAYHLNAASPAVQSGRPYSILQQFRQLGVEVQELFPLLEVRAWQRKYHKIFSRLLSRQYLLDRDETLLRGFADQLHSGLRHAPAQFVFSPSTLPLSYLETDLPVTFCADAPFCAMVNYYDSFTRLRRRQIELSERLEARVVTRAALSVYPTQWAAGQAIEHYHADPAKVAVIPFGANFGSDNDRETVERWIEERAAREQVRLLFIGREWKRKGGDLVVAAAGWLRARGLDVVVDLVGCAIPVRYRHLSFLRVHGALSPRHKDQAQALTALFRQAHLLFVPSRAEAYGMTFCEASAFGLPAISTATGGISEVIRQETTGYALPPEAEAGDYGRVILDLMGSRERYTAMARAAFSDFEQRLNWTVFARTYLQRLAEICPVASASASLPSGDRPAETGTAVDLSRPDKPLRVAFIATDYFDPENVGAWSGLPHFLWNALKAQGVQVELIRLDSRRNRTLRWFKFGAAKIFARRRYLRDRDTGLLRSYARQIERALGQQQIDFLICPGTAPVAYVETKVPIAFWVDACFAGMNGFYGSFTRLTEGSVREGQASDQAALERAALAIYSSDWAADTARNSYRIDPARLHVVPYGANVTNVPIFAEVEEFIRQRPRDVCRLLFVGVDWVRKGADLAVAATRLLEQSGIKAHLTIVGCNAPPGIQLPANVEVLGFVSKSSEAGRQLIERYFRESHIFFLPTRAEAYGLVFCEAGAYALPCVASRVGGISTIVEDGGNGWLLPVEATAEDYAQKIREIWQDPATYTNYALRGRRIFDERLNWNSAAGKVVGLMRRHLQQPSGGAL